ncbi:MAG TPA: hypothetical protein DEG17_26180 [Cyanobacteria bacterium UBA11149]|nr:hypothetical protein [Cyanobacteria bacterium UBA11166]HBS69515.1 hypothetical protein [Cyanobacteria bacterium UBA11153]HBW92258.1 hypothetical protein [Cyanobacteria bacterium UBA11149]
MITCFSPLSFNFSILLRRLSAINGPFLRERPIIVLRCWLLVVGCWLLVVGCWLLVVSSTVNNRLLIVFVDCLSPNNEQPTTRNK